MTDLLPRPAPVVQDQRLREAIEPLYLAGYSNKAALDSVIADLDALATATATVAGDVRAYEEVATEESTTSTTYGNLTTPGPSVTVDIAATDLVMVFSASDIKVASGADSGQVQLYEATDYSGGISLYSASNTVYQTMTYGVEVLHKATAGSRTYTLQYRRGNAAPDTAYFRNRKLWVFTLGGFS